MDVFFRYLLLPVLIWQGLRLRRTALILPEASGPRRGQSGQGASLRLLVLGDSSAAGVGVETQDEALIGHVVRDLAGSFEVTWRLHAKTGVTTTDVLRSVRDLRDAQFDVVVIALGVNDVSRLKTVRRFRADSKAVRQILRETLGARHIVVTDIPPMGAFLALSPLLRWVLGAQARRFSAALAEDLAQESDCSLLQLDIPFEPDLMASDGFHPSKTTYAIWGREAARLIRNACKEG